MLLRRVPIRKFKYGLTVYSLLMILIGVDKRVVLRNFIQVSESDLNNTFKVWLGNLYHWIYATLSQTLRNLVISRLPFGQAETQHCVIPIQIRFTQYIKVYGIQHPSVL